MTQIRIANRAVACFLGAVVAGGLPVAAQGACTFDANGAGKPPLVVPDVDGDGFCDWPAGTRTFAAPLVFTAATPVEFSGFTTIVAPRIVIENGAELIGNTFDLRRLTLSGRDATAPSIVSTGTLDIGARDDIVLQGAGGVALHGPVTFTALDTVVVKSTTGNVTILEPFDDDGGFDIFGGNRVEISATGARGSVDLARVLARSFRIVVRTRSNLSSAGAKHLGLLDTTLTTDRAQTHLVNGSNVQLDATGYIIAEGSTVDATTNVSVATRRLLDDVCLLDDSTLEAGNGQGYVNLNGVRGLVYDDGTTAFVGRLLGADKVVADECPVAGIDAGNCAVDADTGACTNGGAACVVNGKAGICQTKSRCDCEVTP